MVIKKVRILAEFGPFHLEFGPYLDLGPIWILVLFGFWFLCSWCTCTGGAGAPCPSLVSGFIKPLIVIRYDVL